MPATLQRAGIAPEGRRLPQLGLVGRLLLLLLLLLAILWTAVVYQLQRERDLSEESARQQLSNLARAFAEHSAKTLEGADQAIRFVRREFQTHGAAIDLADYVLRRDVIDSAFHQIAIIGADGFMVQSTLPAPGGGRLDLSDRAHFRVHLQGGQDRLFISKPVLGRVSNKWSVQLTRRVDGPDGRLLGVVVLSLAPQYLTRLYSDVDLGADGIVLLAGSDGIVRARQSGSEAGAGHDISAGRLFQVSQSTLAGTGWSTSRIDGKQRLWAYRRLEPYGLVVMVGRGEADVRADVERSRPYYLAGAGAITLLLCLLTALIIGRARAQARLFDELWESNRKAQAANALKSRFLASVSHELRTPLNGIIGYAELVQQVSTDPEVREFGQIIQESGSHLHGLVNTLLDLAKIESGRLQIHHEDVLLAEALEQVRQLHLVSAQRKALALELEIAPGCVALLRTDRMRLLQILGNLVHNAVKFTDHGRVRIAASSTGGRVRIDVSDTGPGIDPARRPTVFERFHAAVEAFTHPMQGAGLGLPLARELAEALGGTLELAPAGDDGVGTRVVLTLPVAPPPPLQEPSR